MVRELSILDHVYPANCCILSGTSVFIREKTILPSILIHKETNDAIMLHGEIKLTSIIMIESTIHKDMLNHSTFFLNSYSTN